MPGPSNRSTGRRRLLGFACPAVGNVAPDDRRNTRSHPSGVPESIRHQHPPALVQPGNRHRLARACRRAETQRRRTAARGVAARHRKVQCGGDRGTRRAFSLRYVVCTAGADHSEIHGAEGLLSRIPTPEIEVADTVGAGDSFTAAFITSLTARRTGSRIPPKSSGNGRQGLHDARSNTPPAMKRPLLILSACLCALAAAVSCSSSQRTADGQSVPDRVMGVYLPYPETVAPAPGAPEGYETFYISHYGRHGSRYLLYDSQYAFVRDVLSRAAADGKLTPSGQKACGFSRSLSAVRGPGQDADPNQAAQHRAIARRMAERHPSAFAPEAAVRASTSATARTQESMEAFCTTLQTCRPSLRITCAEDAALNPYSAGSGIPTKYDLKVKARRRNGGPISRLSAGSRSTPSVSPHCIFTDTDYAAGLCDLTDLEQGAFYLAIHFRGCGITADWLRLFTLDELCTLAACDAYTFYMEKGPAAETSDRTWALSAHILDKMLTDAEQDIADGTAANLRFRTRRLHHGAADAHGSRRMDRDGSHPGRRSPVHGTYRRSRWPATSNGYSTAPYRAKESRSCGRSSTNVRCGSPSPTGEGCAHGRPETTPRGEVRHRFRDSEQRPNANNL